MRTIQIQKTLLLLFFTLGAFALATGCSKKDNNSDSPAADGTATPTPTPTGALLSVTPSVANINAGTTQTFTAAGGTPPYSYSLTYGSSGTIDGSSGVFTAPASTAGQATVVMKDATNTAVYAYISISGQGGSNGGALSLSSTCAVSVTAGGTCTFTGSNGVPPYRYAIASGLGSIDANTGVFTAPATTSSSQTSQIEVLDSINSAAFLTVNIVASAATDSMIYATQNPIPVAEGQMYGQTLIVWNAPNAKYVQIRVGAPDGALFASGYSTGSSLTGMWVSDGSIFYLQDASKGLVTSAANTIGYVIVHLTTNASSSTTNSIKIVQASYGANAFTGNIGNVTAHLSTACDGLSSCTYTISTAVVGDPAYGYKKTFEVYYTCSNSSVPYSATIAAEADGKSVTLSCP